MSGAPFRQRPRRRTFARGFTLIELLVALSGGLFVSVVVFTLARDASRFYQREGRAANATLGAIAGFERLRLDIARAGFMASGNVQSDPWVCTRPGPAAPLLMQRLAAIRIFNGGSPANTVLAANSLAPDSLLLAGSYSSPDEFAVMKIEQNADSTSSVQLDERSSALARLGYNDVATPAARTEKLLSLFAPGRAVRIVDRRGHQHYALVQGASSGTGGLVPVITLAATIPLRYKPANSSTLCGISGFEVGATINVVNFIRYDLRNIAVDGSPYTALFTARAGSFGEADRTELVRAEMDPSNAAGTALLSVNGATPVQELVAEYAVDFELEPTAVTSAANADPTLTQLPSSAVAFATYTGATGTAQRIRAVRVRLGVRSREADRTENVPAASNIAPGTYRLNLGTEGGQARWARIRSLQADVALNNLLGVTW